MDSTTIEPLNSSSQSPESLPEIPVAATDISQTTDQLPELAGLPPAPKSQTNFQSDAQSYSQPQLVQPLSSSLPTEFTANSSYVTTQNMSTHHSILPWWHAYFLAVANHPVHSLVAVGLTLESLYGLFESIEFVTQEYPMLELQLRNHNFESAEANLIVGRVLLILTSIIISSFFALKLSAFKTKVAEDIHLVLGIGLFFINIYLFGFFAQTSLIDSIQNIGDSIINLISSN